MYEIDKTDRDIINLLVEDGRMTASEIARRVGEISERSVRYRIDRMREEGVMKISALPNPKALGFNVVAEVWLEVDTSLVLEVAKRIAGFECVSYVATSIGERDVSVQLIARSNEEVYKIVTEIFGKIPGVRKTTTSIVPVILKDIFDWRVPKSDCLASQESNNDEM
jgi:Lrp/AsnC family transcriptional regulator for asnA, asnC and gidA